MRKFILIIFLLGEFVSLFGQVQTKEIEGVVTYVTAQNVYVKFLSAKKIKVGDNLYRRNGDELAAALVVDHCSSMSCVGKAIGNVSLKAGDKLIAKIVDEEKPKSETTKQKKSNETSNIVQSDRKKISSSTGRKQNINGRILLSSFSNLSTLNASDNYRLRYTLSLNALNIADSKFSMESYISFSHMLDNWATIQANIFNGLKIYSLDMKYELSKSTTFYLGRKINPQISSIGAIDGIQGETKFKNFYFGAVAGFRPDYEDYSFNPNLLEYGAYFGHNYQNGSKRIQTSVALFEQTNAGNTDRRFAYFQHQNSLIKNMFFFVSSELDLYKVLPDSQQVNDLTLTSLYISLNYRPIKKLSIMGSYDNRKNVIYYETYKNYLERLLDDATRQGVQLRVNYKPIKYMNVGVSSSYRMRDNDIRPTQNFNGFLSYAQLPWIKATATLSANLIQTNYLQGNIYGLKLSKDFFDGKLNGGINYRYVDYVFQNSTDGLVQQIGEVELSYYVSRKFSISLDYEGTLEKDVTYHRIYFSIAKRF